MANKLLIGSLPSLPIFKISRGEWARTCPAPTSGRSHRPPNGVRSSCFSGPGNQMASADRRSRGFRPMGGDRERRSLGLTTARSFEKRKRKPSNTNLLSAGTKSMPPLLASALRHSLAGLSPPFTSRRTSHRWKKSEMREAVIFVARFEIDCVVFGSVYGSGSEIWVGFAAARTCFKFLDGTSCFES